MIYRQGQTNTKNKYTTRQPTPNAQLAVTRSLRVAQKSRFGCSFRKTQCYLRSVPARHSRAWNLKTSRLQNLLTYLLTPYGRVLHEKLTGFHFVKKFPAFYGTRRFTTAFTSARHLSLSCASSIQSIPPHPTYWRSILIYKTTAVISCYVNKQSIQLRIYI